LKNSLPETQPQQPPKVGAGKSSTDKSFHHHHHHNASHYKEGPYQHKKKYRSKLGDDTGIFDFLF
jgi:Zn-finger nucleic acid-binding protein